MHVLLPRPSYWSTDGLISTHTLASQDIGDVMGLASSHPGHSTFGKSETISELRTSESRESRLGGASGRGRGLVYVELLGVTRDADAARAANARLPSEMPSAYRYSNTSESGGKENGTIGRTPHVFCFFRDQLENVVVLNLSIMKLRDVRNSQKRVSICWVWLFLSLLIDSVPQVKSYVTGLAGELSLCIIDNRWRSRNFVFHNLKHPRSSSIFRVYAAAEFCWSCAYSIDRFTCTEDMHKFAGVFRSGPKGKITKRFSDRKSGTMKLVNGGSDGNEGEHINGDTGGDTFDPTLYEQVMLRERWADDVAQRFKNEPTSGEVGVSRPAQIKRSCHQGLLPQLSTRT